MKSSVSHDNIPTDIVLCGRGYSLTEESDCDRLFPLPQKKSSATDDFLCGSLSEPPDSSDELEEDITVVTNSIRRRVLGEKLPPKIA